MMKFLWIPIGGLLLAGCASLPTGSVAGGECKITHTPPIAVAGQTHYDQDWIDDTTEALVRGCAQPRPAPRPAGMTMPVKATTRATPSGVVPLPPKKPHWWQRNTK